MRLVRLLQVMMSCRCTALRLFFVRALCVKAASVAGQNVQASQQFVSSRVHWFTGGFFQQLFQVDPKYGVFLRLRTACD